MRCGEDEQGSHEDIVAALAGERYLLEIRALLNAQQRPEELGRLGLPPALQLQVQLHRLLNILRPHGEAVADILQLLIGEKSQVVRVSPGASNLCKILAACRFDKIRHEALHVADNRYNKVEAYQESSREQCR